MISGRGSQVAVLLLLWKEGEKSACGKRSRACWWEVAGHPVSSAPSQALTHRKQPVSQHLPASLPGSLAQTEPPLKEVPGISFCGGHWEGESGVSSRYFLVTHQPGHLFPLCQAQKGQFGSEMAGLLVTAMPSMGI